MNEQLSQWLKTLWPDKPDVSPNEHGWLAEGSKELLEQHSGPEIKYVLEIGSWMGLSTRFILNHCPNALVFCVDPWYADEQGCALQNKPHAKRMGHASGKHFRHVYETFLVNCWEHRHRLFPIRLPSPEGVRVVHEHQPHMDLIYVDGNHTTKAVKEDLAVCLDLFPDAYLTGDDWFWNSVQRGVMKTAEKRGLTIYRHKNAWRLI